MTCKDCIHDGVCHIQEMSTGLEMEEYLREFGCEDFKNKADFLEITKEQAECLVEFLEAEFIQGIGSDPELTDNWYVKTIRSVYEKLDKITE